MLSKMHLIAVRVATVLWAIWKNRNAAYFNKVFPYDPSCVIAKVAHWLSTWADLQIQELRELQTKGAKALLRRSSVKEEGGRR